MTSFILFDVLSIIVSASFLDKQKAGANPIVSPDGIALARIPLTAILETIS